MVSLVRWLLHIPSDGVFYDTKALAQKVIWQVPWQWVSRNPNSSFKTLLMRYTCGTEHMKVICHDANRNMVRISSMFFKYLSWEQNILNSIARLCLLHDVLLCNSMAQQIICHALSFRGRFVKTLSTWNDSLAVGMCIEIGDCRIKPIA